VSNEGALERMRAGIQKCSWLAQLRRKEVRDAILNGIGLITGTATKSPTKDLTLFFLRHSEHQLPLAERARKEVHQIWPHSFIVRRVEESVP
tara:strand:+ start:5607 stop:5882 length:276 start_codon:yes stop_codon:yes gene_type:complete